jgi:DNA-directed RNA polymerase specialized sigma24 family protein
VLRLIAGEEEPEPREDWEKIGPILEAHSADFTDRQRLALTLYYYWALSQREIAALTVVSRSAVQHWLRDALDKVARLEQGASPAQGG